MAREQPREAVDWITLRTDEQAASLRPADICAPMYEVMKAWAESISACACDWRLAPPRKEEMRPVRPPSWLSTELSVPSAALPTLEICVAHVLAAEEEDDVVGGAEVLVGAAVDEVVAPARLEVSWRASACAIG